MKNDNFSKLMRVSALTLSLALVSFVVPASAQSNNEAGASQSSSSANATKTTTSETTTTTQSSKPVQAQTTQSGTTTTAVDPIWLVVGGLGLLAILVIAIMAMRGRSRDKVTAVHERKTVIEK